MKHPFSHQPWISDATDLQKTSERRSPMKRTKSKPPASGQRRPRRIQKPCRPTMWQARFEMFDCYPQIWKSSCLAAGEGLVDQWPGGFVGAVITFAVDGEQLLQLDPRAVNPALDRAYGHACDFRGFLVGKA